MTRLFPLLLLAACGGEVTVATYNAGLAVNFVPGANERAPATAEAIGGIEADVVCLQEVWLPEHVAEVEGAAGEFTEQHFPDPSQMDFASAACEVDDVQPLIDCLDTNCSDVCGDDLPACLLDNCTLPFGLLEPDCSRCAQANVDLPPDEVFDLCTTGGTEYAYGGSFGTGILSKHPLDSVEEHVFDSTTNRRSVIHAVVDGPTGAMDVYCTHLTAVFSSIPFPRDIECGTSQECWEAEQAQQVADMIDFMDSSAETDSRILLGDLNTGPAVGDSDAEVDDNYNLLVDAGYENPYVAGRGECTFCPDNAISSVDSDEDGVVIDHVMHTGFSEGEAIRILDQAVDIESCGQTIPGAHSDHYGVQTTLKR